MSHLILYCNHGIISDSVIFVKDTMCDDTEYIKLMVVGQDSQRDPLQGEADHPDGEAEEQVDYPEQLLLIVGTILLLGDIARGTCVLK